MSGSEPEKDFASAVQYNQYSDVGNKITSVFIKDPEFYKSGEAKLLLFFKLENFKLNDEYNLKFKYAINANMSYGLTCALANSNNEAESILFTANDTGYGYHTVDVNFTLKNLNLTSNNGIYLQIYFSVPKQYGYQFQALFSDIELTNLDDDSGLLDGILNWVSRIYYGIVGGIDREGVNHEGIVQGIKNGLTNLGQSISGFFDNLWEKLKQSFENIGNWLIDVKDGIVNAVNSIKQWLSDLGESIINGLKRLFIPDDGYFESKKTELEKFMTAHFGALYQGPSLMLDFVRKLLTISPKEPGITMPRIQFNFLDKVFTLSDELHYSFSWVNDSSHPVYYFYKVYRAFVIVILFFFFGNYLIDKFHKIFGGGGNDN